jgi:hypothetical protein
MQNGVPWLIAAAITVLVVGAGAGIRLAMIADAAQRARAREAAAAVAQYGLLFGFAAVAAAISAHGLVGFARINMGLPGWWPYLLSAGPREPDRARVGQRPGARRADLLGLAGPPGHLRYENCHVQRVSRRAEPQRHISGASVSGCL